MKQTPESTADYLDRHMIQAMKELAKEGFFNLNKKQTMKQTAVEWLVTKLPLGVKGAILDKIEQAKAMEREQKKDLAYWKANAEEDYIKVPISVLRYITELEKRMYSEEEVIAIVEKSRETGLTAEYLLLTEKFKKEMK